MPRTVAEMAQEVARLLPRPSYVNLGIGMPTAVAEWVDTNEVVLHSENGIVGMGPLASADDADADTTNAAKERVTLRVGAAIVDHDESFAIIRGGRLDVAVLGAYQVSASGDLANWRLPTSAVGSVGGAMDLAVGARFVIAMMRHTDPEGEPKIVPECTYPLTARGCVRYIVTDLATLECAEGGLRVLVMAPGVDMPTLQAATAVRLEGLRASA